MHYGQFTKYADEAFERGDKRTAKRIKTEGKIAAALIDALLAKGAVLHLNDDSHGNGEWTVNGSTDKATVIQAMFTTDGDLLEAHDANGEGLGWFMFIYGNDGWDVISDYRANEFCDEIMKEIQPFVDRAEYDMV
ncbi:hypothetical protein vBCbaSRXM_9 [Citromicrobium phage vB_CbaS-RXM]|nr:hypothetical protein vBCbaSRXM_9 [Citromicrobium phage vB_CbaS-RXM]